MIIFRRPQLIFCTFFISLFSSPSIHANEYVCKINKVSQLNDNGYFVRHGWSANYENREFTVDRDSGRVLRTTALKQRLNNGDLENKPIIINKQKENGPYSVFTNFAGQGKYALLEIMDDEAHVNNPKKPYFFRTDVGMILNGTCIIE